MRTDPKLRRMEEDREMLTNPDQWPLSGRLHLKTQPWAEGEQMFAEYFIDYPLQVFIKEIGSTKKKVERFKTVDELIERWSID